MTPTATHQTAAHTLEWANHWMMPDQTHPINYGVDQATDANGNKYYRAFAFAGGGLDKTLYSPVYEAYDSADVPRHESYIPVVTAAHNKLVADAAVARSEMQAHQAAPSDMRAMAAELQTQARNEYYAYLEMEEEKARKHVYDEQALLAARHLVRGLQLLMDSGTPEEKATIKMLFHTSK